MCLSCYENQTNTALEEGQGSPKFAGEPCAKDQRFGDLPQLVASKYMEEPVVEITTLRSIVTVPTDPNTTIPAPTDL